MNHKVSLTGKWVKAIGTVPTQAEWQCTCGKKFAGRGPAAVHISAMRKQAKRGSK